MVIVVEIALYLAFSIVTGALIIELISEKKRPAIHVSRSILLGSIVAIPVLSFIQLLRLILYLNEDIGFWLTFRSVVFTFEIGQAWLVTLGVSFLLLVTTILRTESKVKSLLGIGFMVILILAKGWASHAASLSEWGGFAAHSAHFMAVSIWIGILMMVAWFSQDTSNWSLFLNWFHPLAIACVLVTVGAGIALMLYVVEPRDYAVSWVITYGQALLIKHLLIIPLLIYAFINGPLMKQQLRKNPAFNPKPWTKAESVVVFLIFTVTAILGETAPPHDVNSTLRAEGPAWLFQLFYPEATLSEFVINIQWDMVSVGLLIISYLILVLLIFSFIKKASAIFSLLLGVLSVVAGYLAFMLSIKI